MFKKGFFAFDILKKNFLALMIIALVIMVGIVSGSFTVKALNDLQKAEIIEIIEQFLTNPNASIGNNHEIFKSSILFNLQTILLIFLSGLIFFGIPFILFILFVRGFFIGFSVAFLVEQLSIKGFILACISIFPQNIIFLPALILCGIASISYSSMQFKKRYSRYKPYIPNGFTSYCFITVLVVMAVMISSLIEAYISPIFVRVIFSLME